MGTMIHSAMQHIFNARMSGEILTAEELRKRVKADLHLSDETKHLDDNFFDKNLDETVVGVLFKVDGEWVLKKYDATTDPGIYWRNNLMNVNGTAILQPGFYKGAFRIGMHQGKYEALVQNVPFKFWRDKNKDDTLDMEGETYTEVAGVNLHHAGAASTQVDKWSAGCQVIANLDNFNELMSIVHKSQAGNTFSYALFTEQQFFDK